MPTSMLNLWNSQVPNFRDPGFRNRYYYNMSHFPFFGDLIRYQDSMNYWNDYFKNRPGAGGWENVKYPSKMDGAGALSSTARASVGFVSKNLMSLYDKKPVKNPNKWVPVKHPEPFQPSYVGIRKINGRGQFYRYNYR